MKKLLIPAFVCTAAMLTACGDDNSSSASSEAVESSSSIADASSSSVAAESSSSDWAHEDVGSYLCLSDKDTATVLGYAFEGPDSAMEVIRYEYPEMLEDIDNVCEEVEEENCKHIDEISDSLKTMTFDSLKALMAEECYYELIINAVDLTDPDEAPENDSLWKKIKRAAKKIGDGVKSLF